MKTQVHTKTSKQIFIAALFTMAKNSVNSNVHELVNKQITMEHYSTTEGHQLWICETTWMNLKSIMLSERSQPQNTIKPTLNTSQRTTGIQTTVSNHNAVKLEISSKNT